MNYGALLFALFMFQCVLLAIEAYLVATTGNAVAWAGVVFVGAMTTYTLISYLRVTR